MILGRRQPEVAEGISLQQQGCGHREEDGVDQGRPPEHQHEFTVHSVTIAVVPRV